MLGAEGEKPVISAAHEDVARPASAEGSEKENGTKPRQPSKGSEPFEQWERDEMEKLLGQMNGHLGGYSTFVLV